VSVLKDVFGNVYRGWIDQTTGQTITDTRPITANIAAAGAEVIIDLNCDAVCVFDLRGSAALTTTLIFEGLVDGANPVQLPAFANFQQIGAVLTTEQFVGVITVAAATFSGLYTVGVSGFRRVRIRALTFTAGPTITVAMRSSRADFLIYTRPLPVIPITGTAAVNTALTITLPAAGVGLYHYITSIEWVKLYSVIGVAAGAGVLITSTNIPGNPVWTTEQLASAAGSAPKVIDKVFPNPIKSSVANTNTTIVAPAQLQTIWRGNVTYYVGA
jgi:hypothetical protein